MRVVVTVLNVVLAVVYPLAIWWSLAHFSPRVVGLLVMALVLPTIYFFRPPPVLRWQLTRVGLHAMCNSVVSRCGSVCRLCKRNRAQ